MECQPQTPFVSECGNHSGIGTGVRKVLFQVKGLMLQMHSKEESETFLFPDGWIFFVFFELFAFV